MSSAIEFNIDLSCTGTELLKWGYEPLRADMSMIKNISFQMR